MGYERTSIVRDKSEFAIRGSIIDIFLAQYNKPIRIDLFDNDIESIFEFDASNITLGISFLRISVDGGGCSGFSYSFSFDYNTKDEDIIAFTDSSGYPTLVTDNTSMIYLNGSKINWDESLNGAAFTIDNPNATSNCGCGTSFSVT